MIISFIEKLYLCLFIVGMVALTYYSPIWYVHPLIMGTFLCIWFYYTRKSEKGIVLLLCGEFSCVAAWFVSPFLAWVIQIPVIGLFLLILDIPHNKKEKLYSIILFGVLGVITVLSDQINHTVIPVILILIASVLVILGIVVTEFRFKKQFRVEKI